MDESIDDSKSESEKRELDEYIAFLRDELEIIVTKVRRVETSSGDVVFTTSDEPIPGFETDEPSLYEGMHSVVVYFNYGLEDDEPFYELVYKLIDVLSGIILQ